jgi:crotonobetainyl-CoA:carnitine CoA-transferase CaiB-like acyl-CoA transferase/flavin reductase (DIM6/NTAB) family NADH-FMN oxidoreductase RutF
MTGGILRGLRVLDLSRMLSGPYATMMLADHGAEVLKIEDAQGDTSRMNGPYRDDDPGKEWAGYFVSLNRSKKSLQLDLKSEDGRQTLRRLVRTADVLVENYRPGVMERLGLSYESLAEINPRLVYAALRGFGDPRTGESPYAKWPAYDVVAQAMGGLISVTGADRDHPTKVGPGIGDVFAGMVAAFGILAALRAAEATGRGQFLDVAMYDAMLSLCERLVYQHDFDGTVPGPEGNGHPLLAPFGLYPSADGMVAIGVVDDAFWRILAEAMGRADLGRDAAFATRAARRVNMTEVNALVADWTRLHSRADLTALLGGRIPFGPVNDIAAIFADPHVAARGMIATIPHAEPGKRPWRVAANPLRFASSPAPAPVAPSRLGADQALAAQEDRPGLDARALRSAFGAFATGVTVITTRQADGTPRGFTANSFTSVSLDPPLLLVCLAKSAHSCEVFAGAPHFAVNVLGEDQKAVSGLFASRAPDKFQQCDWAPGHAGVPVLSGALAQFVCARHRLVDAGDHLVLIGRVEDFAATEGRPLGYFRGSYFSIGLERDLAEAAAAARGGRIGAVLACDGGVLMARDAEGRLCLPLSPGPSPSLDALEASLRVRGLSPAIEFVYAAFDDRTTGGHAVYYHGRIDGAVPEGYRIIPLGDLNRESFANEAEAQMLARYAADFRNGTFSIYHGNETVGSVRRVTAE